MRSKRKCNKPFYSIFAYFFNIFSIVIITVLYNYYFAGAVSLEYPLSLQPVYGQNWTIRVVAQGQIEEKQFAVEEYCE
jgi:hypothetical protein